jgi:hypothetical protein
LGVDFLRQHNESSYIPIVKKQTSPVIAVLLSVVPGLGAAYNGQMMKALSHFAIFVGLFQMGILTKFPMFFLGSMGMWAFAAFDAGRTAQLIRTGVSGDNAEDILSRRTSGNSKIWGTILAVLGTLLLTASLWDRFLISRLLPVGLIALGIYILSKYIFRGKNADSDWKNYESRTDSPNFVTALAEPQYHRANFDSETEFSDRSRSGSWRNR